MSTYNPDGWVIVKITYDEKVGYRIFADWAGSYLYGASWKLSSGITDIVEEDEEYVITNYSGSVYYCRKTAQGRLGSFGMSVLKNAQDEHGEENFAVVDIKEVNLGSVA